MIDIKDLFIEELSDELKQIGVESFRVKQLLDWIYKKYVCDFDKMTNLPPVLRSSLKEKFYISAIKLLKELVSKDGTRKFLFKLEDGERIETVFIPSRNTNTVCVSSQVGCKFSCQFCASGKGGFIRNLRPAEMINQILYVRKCHCEPLTRSVKGEAIPLRGGFALSKKEIASSSRLCRDSSQRRLNVTNVVFMGMGEPFDNYDNVLKAVKILNAPYGLGIGQRKLTISTCGIIPGIEKLAREDLQIELSISLHSANDKTRSTLMGINNKYPIKELIAACWEYIKETNRQITFEYVLIKDINDSKDAALGLARLIKGMLAPLDAPSSTTLRRQRLTGLAKVNLIAFNPVEGIDYAAPDAKTIKEFKRILNENNIISTVRASRGQDIEAACGQLWLKK